MPPTAEIIRADCVEFWQEVVCRTLFVGECAHVDESAFHGEVSTIRGPHVALTWVRSARQRFARTSQHLRDSRSDSFFLFLQVAGTGVVSQHGRSVALEPGDLTCLDSTSPSVLTFPDDFEQLVVHLPRELVVTTLGPAERLVTQPSWLRSPIVSTVSACLRHTAATVSEVTPTTSQRLGEISVSLIMTMLGELSMRCVDHPALTRTTLRYHAEVFIHAHAHDHELNPETVAKHLRISTRYLQDVFRDEHTTPSECIWQSRLRASRQDLSDPLLTSLTISAIAIRCGFLDFAHFSHRFKAAYGMSPRDFRQQHRSTWAVAQADKIFCAVGQDEPRPRR